MRCGSRPKCWNTIDTLCGARRAAVADGRGDVDAVDRHRARGRLDQPGEAAHERRLAAAGQTHHHEHLAGRDVEVDVADRHDVAGARLEHLARQVGEFGPDDALGARPVHLPQIPNRDHRLCSKVSPPADEHRGPVGRRRGAVAGHRRTRRSAGSPGRRGDSVPGSPHEPSDARSARRSHGVPRHAGYLCRRDRTAGACSASSSSAAASSVARSPTS